MHRFMTQCACAFTKNAISLTSHAQTECTFWHQMLFFPTLENMDIFESLEGCSVHVHTTAKTPVETLLLCSGFNFLHMQPTKTWHKPCSPSPRSSSRSQIFERGLLRRTTHPSECSHQCLKKTFLHTIKKQCVWNVAT